MAKELSKTLWRALLPIALSAGVAVWLFKKDIDMETLRSIRLDGRVIAGLLLALFFAFGRDFGLSWRFHTIADGALSWRRSFRTDLMCAFTSAITPSVVGGSALAIFYLNREGIKLGRATTLTLTTLFLDELFFVVFCPLIILIIPSDDLFGNEAALSEGRAMLLGGVRLVFWLVYTGIVIWTAILYLAIIGKPEMMERLLKRIGAFRIMRRFRAKIDGLADNMLATSQWVKAQSRGWWIRVLCGTVVSWFSRYFVVNALFWTFIPSSSQLLVFCRQFVVWVVLMVSPTPGGSGISEWLFATYYGDLIGATAMAAILALIWRFFSYYIYLVIGIALLPAYFGEHARRRAENSK